MTQFFLSYSETGIDGAIDLMDVGSYFVTAHTFRRSEQGEDATLDLIVTVVADDNAVLGAKLAYLKQVLDAAPLAGPPNNVGKPLLLWAQFGREQTWTIWTVKGAVSAPIDLGTARGEVYQLHVRLSIWPHSLGQRYAVSGLRLDSNQLLFVAAVPGSELAAARLTLDSLPPSLAKVYVGLRGHPNLQVRGFNPHYPASGSVTTTQAWQTAVGIVSHGQPFDTGLFDVFVAVADEAPFIGTVADLSATLGTGNLFGGQYEYLQVGMDSSGRLGRVSNVAYVTVPGSPLVYSGVPNSRYAQGGRIVAPQIFSLDAPAYPSITPAGARFAVQSDGWVMQDLEESPLLCPACPQYGTVGPTNKRPPKAGQLGYTTSVLRQSLPLPKTEVRSALVTVDLAAIQLGGLGSPVFFPLLGDYGLSYDLFGWRLYAASGTEPPSAYVEGRLVSSPLKAPLALGTNSVGMCVNWAGGFTQVTVTVGGKLVGLVVTLGQPAHADVFLGAYVTNALPEWMPRKVLDLEEARWSYSKVAINSISDSASSSISDSEEVSAAIQDAQGKMDQDTPNQTSHSSSVSGNGQDSKNGSKSSAKSGGSNFTVSSGGGNNETESISTHTVTFANPVSDDYTDTGEHELVLGDGIWIDNSHGTILNIYDGSTTSPYSKFSPVRTVDVPDNAEVSAGGDYDHSSGGDLEDSQASGGGDSHAGGSGGGGSSSITTGSSHTSSTTSSHSVTSGKTASHSESTTTSHSESSDEASQFDVPRPGFNRLVTFVAMVATHTVSSSSSSDSKTSSSVSSSFNQSLAGGSAFSTSSGGSGTNGSSGSGGGTSSKSSGSNSAANASSSGSSGTSFSKADRTDKRMAVNSLTIADVNGNLIPYVPVEGPQPTNVVSYTQEQDFGPLTIKLGNTGLWTRKLEDGKLKKDRPFLPVTYDKYVETNGLLPASLYKEPEFQITSGIPLTYAYHEIPAHVFAEDGTRESTTLYEADAPDTFNLAPFNAVWWNGKLLPDAVFYADPDTAIRTSGIPEGFENRSDSNATNNSSATNTGSDGSKGFDSTTGDESSESHGSSSEHSESDSSSNSTTTSSNNSNGTNTSTGTTASTSTSTTTSDSYEDVYLIQPLLDTIIPATGAAIASVDVTFSGLEVFDGPLPPSAGSVLLTWAPQEDIAGQRLYRRNTSIEPPVWQYRQLGAGISSFVDNGDSDWRNEDPPGPGDAVKPGLMRLTIDGTMNTSVVRTRLGFGRPHYLRFGPVALGARPKAEPEFTDNSWTLDVDAKGNGYALHVSDIYLLPHCQPESSVSGVAASWAIESNRYGQTIGSDDAIGEFKLSPGNNVIVVLGEDANQAPVVLEGISAEIAITPESEWLQSV